MKNILSITLILFSITAWSQENIFTLSGGYAFANVEEVDTDATGWRINGLFEFNPQGGNVAHGLSVGYIGTSAEYTVLSENVEYNINSWPIYYAPKFMFGNESMKGFIKGALGMQFSGIKRTGPAFEIKDNDFGFYGGASAGLMKIINEKMFINVEYEWAYLSNSYYKDGFMNSVMLGIGMKF
jgi:hypothetical protein